MKKSEEENMSKIYFEMTETERELNFLGQTVDYAGTRFAEGLGGNYKGLTTKEVIDVQSKIAEHLFEASSLIGKLLEGTSKLEDDEIEVEDTVTNKS